ncbi:NAD(P)H-dependent oxidoreductase subunit E [Methylocystis parvus]|uniref:NADH-quinone oxidoreductase subunit D-related protein n=1 Tax=Methylocystis parvus TaxID=134 RepID=UPI003C747EBF
MSAPAARACTPIISVRAASRAICRINSSRTSALSAIPFLKVCDDLEGLLIENRIFKQRNVDIGVISLEDAWAWGFSGVMVRGSGAAWDLRKAQPYECYEEMEFDIPVGKNGDCYDRAVIRMEEMRQSTYIMKQCVEKLLRADGRGPVLTPNHKITQPSRDEMKRSMEALIQHFKLFTEGFHVPAGEVYAAVEAPKGEFGVYLVSGRRRQAVSLQDPRAGLRASSAMDFICRPHARRRLGDPWFARYRLRGGRSLMSVRRLAEQPTPELRFRNHARCPTVALPKTSLRASPSRRKTRRGSRSKSRNTPTDARPRGRRCGREQNDYWLPQAAIEKVAELLGMPKIRVLEVATFYTMFNLEPVGKFISSSAARRPACCAAPTILIKVLERKVGPQRKVTADGLFSWLEVECLGACCNAPMVQINDDYYEDLTPENFEKLLDDLAAGRPVKTGSQKGRVVRAAGQAHQPHLALRRKREIG